MALLPALTVPAPTVAPARFGLFSAATAVIDTSDPHLLGGVEFDPVSLCATGNVVGGDLCAAPVLGGTPNSSGWITSEPMVLSTIYECQMEDPAIVQAKAVATLAANEERLLSIDTFTWAFDSADVDTIDGTSLDFPHALAMLEAYARYHYSGTPVLHLPGGAASLLTGGGGFVRMGESLQSALGSRVHVQANRDNTTMYVTSALTIFRGPAQVTDAVADAGDSMLTGVRTNLVTNPSFESDLAGWTAVQTTQDTTAGQSGTANAKLGPNAIAPSLNITLTPKPGVVYTVSAYVRTEATNTGSWRLRATPAPSGAATVLAIPASVPTFTRVSMTFGPYSAAVTSVWVGFERTSAGALDVLHVDSVQVEESSSATAYFDGNTADTPTVNYAWTGTAGASTSTASTTGPGRSNTFRALATRTYVVAADACVFAKVIPEKDTLPLLP